MRHVPTAGTVPYPQTAAVVLAGGLSSRLGQDKARLRLPAQDGHSLLERTRQLALHFVPHCWTSCRSARQRDCEADVLVDFMPGCGPAGGIYTALTRAAGQGFRDILVLPCDLPFLDEITLQRLFLTHATAPPQTLLTAYAAAESGRMEALVGIYDVTALPFFAKALQEGQRAVRDIIPARHQNLIFYTSADSRPFLNLNTPEDLYTVKSLLASCR